MLNVSRILAQQLFSPRSVLTQDRISAVEWRILDECLTP